MPSHIRFAHLRRTFFAAVLVAGGLAALAGAVQAQEARDAAVSAANAAAARATLPLESAVTSENTVTIRGRRVPYRVTAGTLPVYDTGGTPIAALFYVYYERSDVDDRTSRPLAFSFNGGPGSSSVWMHLGYTGPMRVNVDDEGYPVRPYGFQENSHSILDETDIVYVDPVNVGLSRPVEGTEVSQFFGVNQDIAYLARWIELFVDRNGRWASPKFLIGESYGTTRVSGLAGELQATQKMYFNGVVLVSPTSLGISRSGPVGEALRLPHYAATAWYHGALPADLQGRELDELLPEVEEFTINEYMPALVHGGFLPVAERSEIAQRVARYAGVSPAFVENNNLAIPIGHWRKELLRDRRLTVGRLDSRYQGVDRDAAGITYDYDPAMSSWNHSFTPAMNIYLRDYLGYATDLVYYTIGGPVRPWDNSGNTTGENLRRAMAENPYLKTMIQSGYYDGATDYFSARYTMWQLDRSGQLRDRLRQETYRSGHMMYLREEDRATANQHLRDFFHWAIPENGMPALWGRRVPVTATNGR